MTTIFTLDAAAPLSSADAGLAYDELQKLKAACQGSFTGFSSEANAVVTKTGPQIDAAVTRVDALGTSGTPQFAGVNVGHATDTTLERAAAGQLSVEGNVIPHITASGTFADTDLATIVGFSADPTFTMKYKIDQDSLVTIWVTAATMGTSNATTFQFTGWPAALRATTNSSWTSAFAVGSEGSVAASNDTAFATIATDGTVTLLVNGGTNDLLWRNSGRKGIRAGTVIQYYKD